MSLPNLIIDDATNKIIAFGYCDFTPQLKTGQSQAQCNTEQLPDDMENCIWDSVKKIVVIHDPWKLNNLKAHLKTVCKADANKRIYAVSSKVKDDASQRNLLERENELIYKKVVGTISAEEESEIADTRKIWTDIRAIRVASNITENEIDALATEQDVIDYKY